MYKVLLVTCYQPVPVETVSRDRNHMAELIKDEASYHVGFLIEKSEEHLILAQKISREKPEILIKIPDSCIKSIEIIYDPEKKKRTPGTIGEKIDNSLLDKLISSEVDINLESIQEATVNKWPLIKEENGYFYTEIEKITELGSEKTPIYLGNNKSKALKAINLFKSREGKTFKWDENNLYYMDSNSNDPAWIVLIKNIRPK